MTGARCGWRGAAGSRHIASAFTPDGVAPVHDRILATAVSLQLPKALPPRVRIMLEDAVGHETTITLRIRDTRPDAGFDKSTGALARTLAYAAWLTGLQEGRWTLEAARVLSGDAASDPAAIRLRAQIAAGWRIGLVKVPQAQP